MKLQLPKCGMIPSAKFELSTRLKFVWNCWHKMKVPSATPCVRRTFTTYQGREETPIHIRPGRGWRKITLFQQGAFSMNAIYTTRIGRIIRAVAHPEGDSCATPSGVTG